MSIVYELKSKLIVNLHSPSSDIVFHYYKTGAYLYNSCMSGEMAAAAATDYNNKRSAAVETCENATQYWPGKIHANKSNAENKFAIRFALQQI